jgi:Outer membrane protein beta-barrel domain
MRISTPTLTFVCTLAVLPVVPAAAQTTPRPAPGAATVRSAPGAPRVWIGANAGYQASTTEFDDSFTFTIYQETGTTRVTYPIDAGFAFDVGGGVRLWRGLGAGIAVSRFTRDGTVSTTSSVPHPLFLAQNRQVEGDADAIRREETGIHIQAQYTIPLSRTLQLTLMGGPSVLQVNQAVVTNVNYSQEYPYDTATLSGVDSTRIKDSATGFNAGADLRWMLSRSFGIGGVVRFSRATIDLEVNTPANRTISVDAGGVYLGAGVRFAF